MTDLLLHNARVILSDRIERGGVVVRDGRVAQVFVDGQTPTGFGAADAIDLAGAILTPGMMDIHIHGSAAADGENAAPRDRVSRAARKSSAYTSRGLSSAATAAAR